MRASGITGLDVCFHRLGSVFTAVFTFLEMRYWKELFQGRRLRLAVSLRYR
jgi:hypothetical protein